MVSCSLIFVILEMLRINVGPISGHVIYETPDTMQRQAWSFRKIIFFFPGDTLTQLSLYSGWNLSAIFVWLYCLVLAALCKRLGLSSSYRKAWAGSSREEGVKKPRLATASSRSALFWLCTALSTKYHCLNFINTDTSRPTNWINDYIKEDWRSHLLSRAP